MLATPTDVKLDKVNGKPLLTWSSGAVTRAASNPNQKYKILRANSRFGEYKEIAETTDLSFVDENPNTESKYANYYKIQSVVGDTQSLLTEATSEEIEMFGQDFCIFTPNDDPAKIFDQTEAVYSKQHTSQFGNGRYVFAYKAGDYTKGENLINVGYYTQVIGLGKSPLDAKVYNVHCPAALADNNATCNFWCGIENLCVKDLENNDDAYFDFTWSVSQAAPARRLDVERKGHFDWYYGWASGGFIADSHFHKSAGSFSQQQYYYRNCQVDGGFYGVNWNQVIHGCSGFTTSNSSDNSGKGWGAGAKLKGADGFTTWDQRGCTSVVNNTEVIREKPFMYFDQDSDSYKVFVPALRKNVKGISWTNSSMGDGTILDVKKSFYVARADRDSADTINEQLAAGKNIILAPGVFRVKSPIHVTKPNTIILGLGMATILPDNEDCGLMIEDVGGVSIAGIIMDAGKHSATLVTVGKEGCNQDHSANPIVLQDVIYRVGGTGELGTCDSCLVINSNNTIVDHTWIWRADHGNETGWNSNKSKNGLVVNGDNVIFYGLFCEHFQEYDILWRGENGKTYFLQNEKAYDPQNQAEWKSHGGEKNGYAAYKVCNNVKKHYALGLGVYDVFINTGGASIYLDNAIEVPNTADVLIENAVTVEIANGDGPKVGINHIINNTGFGIRTGAGQTGGSGYALQRVLSYNNGNSIALNDYYQNEQAADKVNETGENPTDDEKAEKNISKEGSSKGDEKPVWEMTDADYGGALLKGIPRKIGLKVGQTITQGEAIYRVKRITGPNTAEIEIISMPKNIPHGKKNIPMFKRK